MVVSEPIGVVEDFRIGRSRIRISDDYCKAKTPQDIEKILQNIAKRAILRIGKATTEKDL
jgi:hypothetical protein